MGKDRLGIAIRLGSPTADTFFRQFHRRVCASSERGILHSFEIEYWSGTRRWMPCGLRYSEIPSPLDSFISHVC